MGLGLVGTTPQPGGWVLPSRLQELYMAENPNITGPISPGWRLPDSKRALFGKPCHVGSPACHPSSLELLCRLCAKQRPTLHHPALQR